MPRRQGVFDVDSGVGSGVRRASLRSAEEPQKVSTPSDVRGSGARRGGREMLLTHGGQFGKSAYDPLQDL